MLKLVNFCIRAPLIWLKVIDFHRIQEFIAIKSSYCINGASDSCDPSIASWWSHISHHLPFIFSWIIHLHTTDGMRTIKATTYKQFSLKRNKTVSLKRLRKTKTQNLKLSTGFRFYVETPVHYLCRYLTYLTCNVII